MVSRYVLQCFNREIHIICFVNNNADTYGVAEIYCFDLRENSGYVARSRCFVLFRPSHQTHTMLASPVSKL